MWELCVHLWAAFHEQMEQALAWNERHVWPGMPYQKIFGADKSIKLKNDIRHYENNGTFSFSTYKTKLHY